MSRSLGAAPFASLAFLTSLTFSILSPLVAPLGAGTGLAAAASPSHEGQAKAGDPKPTTTATPTKEPIRLDAVLSEPAWATARPIGPLIQREPREEVPATEETEVRVLFTSDALYFGIVCRDRTPSRIVSTQLTRDAELDVDDSILVILDPFLDNRNGFYFQVNPAGARTDGQVSNNT